VRLYRDDVEQLMGLLADAGMQVRIRDNSFEYSTLDELTAGAGRSPRTIKIEAKVPDSYKSVSLEFSSKRWHIYTLDSSLRGIARECEARLRRRQTAVEHIPILWIGMPGWLIVLMVSTLAKNIPSIAPSLLIVGLALLAIAGGLGIYWNLYPKIILRFKHEAGFLQRNRDQLLLLIAGAVIGSLVPWIVGQILAKP
jgi:hypothetical protein